MIDFIEYVVSELKNKRLSKENALDLVRQFSGRTTSPGKPSILHPLLHTNASDLYRQCYVSCFGGDEFFLNDHRVAADGADAIKVLPGVAYLEMARAAIADALPDLSSAHRVRLDDVVWMKPIVVTEPKNVFIGLTIDGDDRVGAPLLEFEIFSSEPAGEQDSQETVHCRGMASLIECDGVEKIDIESLQARMGSGSIDASVVYPAYRAMGMKFGPAHQSVVNVLTGEREAVARLALPSAVDGTLDEYELHPSLVDGALQAAIGLLGDLRQLPDRPSVPFAVESVRSLSGCTREMYAWIRYSPDARPDDKVNKLDIDLCDDQGRVCAQFRGFSSRALSATADVPKYPSSEPTGVVIASPVWRDSVLEAHGPTRAAQHHVLLCELPGLAVERLQAAMPNARFHAVAAGFEGLAERFVEVALTCFKNIATLAGRQPKGGHFVHVVVPDAGEAKLLSALSGLLKSTALEHPDVEGQLLLVDAGIEADALSACLQAEYRATSDVTVRYLGGQRQVLRWQELPLEGRTPQIAFKEDGVYLVTGGLGGLGTLFAGEILQKTTQAKVVLTGRAEHSPNVEEKLKKLAPDDATRRRLEYRALDLTDPVEVRRLLAAVAAAHGGVNGIIHSAGMIADNLISRKAPEEFSKVLAPKVVGTVNLDLASEAFDLDFLVLFSSGASVMGNIGQSDYAVANGFLDQFAHYRNRLVESGRRKGKTLAINWPLWQDGGMRMARHDREAMRELTGMHAMRTSNGMEAFHRSLSASRQQALVVEGDLEKIRRALFEERWFPFGEPASGSVTPVASAVADAGKPTADLSDQTRDYLRKQFSGLFKLPYHKVDPRAPLEKYGIDSILAMDLTRQLEKTFGSLSKTLFFEHQTIEELTDYFLRSHTATLQSLFEASERPRAAPTAPTPAAAAAPRTARAVETGRLRRNRGSRVVAVPAGGRSDEPVAIVGLSGRYPESVDIDAFWENLRDGQDCITEIPKDRWDWREYYSQDRTVEGAHYSKWGGFIAGVDEFDPLFFNIPPVDAELLDPQERLFLQHAWMAVEDAGYTRARLQIAHDQAQTGQVGVYVGVMYGEYQLFGAESSLRGKRIGVPVSYASIANRVSYVMDLHGPSMTLDTMCSSSLAAIHLACQDLKQGRTHLAIAGGVNVTIHPNKYLILSAGQYISGDGHCQSFGVGGDGYIPGEGVGAVVLKRLSEAQQDGNHIYGLIKGSALNHGGKTNGYSVPNPKAQANVIDRAMNEYGVDARHVSYIEAHGTGTKLGDPIEIAALTHVFRQYTQERGFCAIGSAKSNIGHCESAAGIAGLTKVLLQMKHRTIVPSLHSSTLNPHIDFEASPFAVNQASRPWEPPVIDGRRVPRIAGVSSFGAGGSNAHLIVEEYHQPTMASPSEPPGQVIVPLSARTRDQLVRKVQDLLAFLRKQDGPLDLASMAYTLQVGREAMDARLGLVVDSAASLMERLEAYAHGEPNVDGCFEGRIEEDADGMSLLSQDEDMLEAVDKWIARGKLAKLAELWVRGFDLDWRKLHAGRRLALTSLPTYPFAKDRYWVNRHLDQGAASGAKTPVLHPLLHTNTSDFFQQSYASEFTGDEFFFADHRIDIGGDGMRRLLPGVACLEMVRVAVDLALPAGAATRRLELRNVAWVQPVVVDGSKRVSVALTSDGERIVDFEVLSGDEQEPVIHCQGQAEVSGASSIETTDLEALKARMTGGSMSAVDIYDAFQAMGIHYGPSFRCVAAIHKSRDELLAELALPAAQDACQNEYVLHPGLLDSALQASIGLVADLTALPNEPTVPFALDSVVLAAPCASQMFAWVRHAKGAVPDDGISKIDIDLYDAAGRVCVRLKGLASRAIRVGAQDEDIGLLLACPEWEAVPAAGGESVQLTAYSNHRVLLCDLPQLDPDRLQATLPGADAEQLSLADAEDIADRYRLAALACFERLQAILKDAALDRTLFQVVVADEGDDTLLAGLSGLVDTARLENPNLVGQLVLVDRSVDERALAERLRAARAHSGDSLFKCRGEMQNVLRWRPEQAGDDGGIAFRDGGVYLITGGLGGLGRLFAREILERAEDAVVVLTGRSELDPDKRAELEALTAELSLPADRLAYRQLDLGQLESVEALIAGVMAEYGGLAGVLHSAGMIRDGFIINKSAAEFAQVLEPKVRGTLHLDLATQRTDLDFFVLFSSAASALGNVGQADYAAANGFMDRFAGYRHELVQAGRRCGKTLSIQWPLWQDGGMQLDAETRDLLTMTSGMVPLKTASGMRAFHRSLRLGAARSLVIEGHLGRLRRSLDNRHTAAVAAPPATTPAVADVDASTLLEKTQRYLIDQFSSLLRIPAHEVEAKAPLEKYGIDSVLAMKLTNQLERSFGSLSKTLFFEYQTIASLAGYLVRAFPDMVREKTGIAADGGPGRDPASAAPLANRPSMPIRSKVRPVAPASKAENDVAIVGIGGRYPLAATLREFWENLKNGRDCITEIPEARWDYAPLYHPARNRPGKTYSKWGGFLSDVDLFDALFFNISPKEAELIDPQERLFIETVWETIEDAGYSKDAIAQNRVGVYVGVMWGQYELYASAGSGVPSSSFASIANRVSYFFDFHGPSLALDTMCSSSLTAIHLASEDVRKGAVDVAIAGGVNVSIHPSKYLSLSQGNFASTDGRCRSFGEGGDGYVPGEGVGAVLLKPLDKAVRDGDRILAVVKASSINHGGKTNGYTVPNPIAQSDLILDVLTDAGVAPETIGYIETHGTGTSLGDPIEITGLVRAFEGDDRPGGARGEPFCPIGSVKSNIGHLESAAGIAAVTKVLLQFEHQQLAPSLHAERLNPHIDFQRTPFYVQRSLEDWKRPQGHPRRAGVSSFGAGGANAHLILEEFVDSRQATHRPDRPEALVLSARSRQSLFAYAGRMIEFLDDAPSDLSLTDIAFTSQIGRTPMQERLVVVALSKSVLKDRLQQWLHTATTSDALRGPAVDGTIEDAYEGSTKQAQGGAAALIEGDAGMALLQLALEQRDLAKLAKLWVSGVEIDWASLYRTDRPQRVCMPTYPFARERYWIETRTSFGAPSEPEARKQMLHYRTEWRSTPPVAVKAERAAAATLLLLGGDDSQVAEVLRQSWGAAVVTVQYADAYRQVGPDTYCVDPRSEGDFVALVNDLASKCQLPHAIAHLADEPRDIGRQLDRGLFALHALCKAVMKHKTKDAVRIVALQRQRSDEFAALHQALAGYLKSLTLENPKFSWKVVSLDGEPAGAEVARILSDEIRDTGWRNNEISYLHEWRGDRAVSHRQIRQVKRYAPSAAASAGASVKHNGVYIVTGGLGGLGYIFSDYLAKQYGAQLVLTGRSVLDEGLRAKLASLKSRSGDAIYVQADVSDPDQADAVVRETKRRFSRIDGLIHSAGVHRDAFVLNKARDDMESVLAAKVMGTINLDRATRHEDLDLFVLFSSVAGAFGNPGQCDYAFANSFLDAFAERRQARVASRERSGKTLSINWPFWEDGRMRLSQSDIDLMESRTGLSPLPTEQGIRYWESFLQSDQAQGIALYGDPSKIEAYLSRSLSDQAPSASSAPPKMDSAEMPSLREATEHYLKTLLGEQIKLPIDRIDSQERFESFGVDSMMISRINADLERDLGELPKTLFYEYATIEELAGYLLQETQAALADRFDIPDAAFTAAEPAIAETACVERAPVRGPAEAAPRVAIIGVHGRFPHSESLAEYWQNLRDGRDLVDLVPESRWGRDEFFDADPANATHGKIYCQSGGFLDDVDKFDAAFFSVAPDDARMIDPQERLFIQSVWAAVEDAGYTRDSLKKRHPKAKSADVGVFVGVTTNSYHLLAPEEWRRGNMVAPGAMPWSIANRVSYFFDFQGPSMPVDTACSSSLAAIHLACESLSKQECQVAVAGGVNLYLHPAKYQSLCRRRMLAMNGKCRSFGDGDDGFIPGEGVGAVVLKPLARAIDDRDHVYGVIAASACEHSGRSNGYSAPNPNSQALLIEQALDRAGIDPESIGYVEGHGTGTQLGDSLEVVSLAQAFGRRTQKKRFCSLGSVKANVGHSESAAGIAGVAKILLQFKHREIAPTIHSHPVNPNIDFENSAFYLQHALTPWSAVAGHPRRAMVNSFGAGGVNACLILEDYEPLADPGNPVAEGAHLVALSARNEQRLRESVIRLRDHVKSEATVDLCRLAYTLQVGREAMEERLAVVVSSQDELLAGLSAYATRAVSPALVFGRVEPRQRRKSVKQEERARAKSLFDRGGLGTLALMWVQGQDIDWDDLHGTDHPRRLPLPTYPFAKERYWVSDSPAAEKSMAAAGSELSKLHPLVSHNASTLKEVCFSSSLSGTDYYGRDHRINGEPLFPAAGFLEIACVNGIIAGDDSVVRIEDVVWVQPLRLAAEDNLVKTFLRPNGDNAEYVIVSFDDDNERVVHSEGRVLYGARSRHGDQSQPAYQIEDLKHRAPKVVQGSQCYRQFEGAGLQYGRSFRTIQELYVGSGFALSELKLADELKGAFEQYVLHPCLIDGALQTVAGIAAEADPGTPYLPFALDALEIRGALTQTCYAYVEHAAPEHSANAEIKQFDIRLLSESGQVLVKLDNFCVRALRAAPAVRYDQTDDLLLTE